MGYHEAQYIIWAPDEHPLVDVAEASVTILETPRAESADARQASYLLTTYRRALS